MNQSRFVDIIHKLCYLIILALCFLKPGRTLFYIFGGLMVAGAAILLVTKKRMSAEG